MKIDAKVIEFLKANKVWYVGTYGDTGAHVVPCYHTEVLDEETLVVSAVFLKQTLKNVEANGDVAISISAPKEGGGWEGYQIKGKGSLATGGKAYEVGKELVGEKPIPYNGALVIKVSEGAVTAPGPNLGKSVDNVEW